MIGRDSHVVGPGVQHVEDRFRLGQEMVPLVDGEVGMRANEDREKVVSKSLVARSALFARFWLGGTRSTMTCCCLKNRTRDSGHSLSRT